MLADVGDVWLWPEDRAIDRDVLLAEAASAAGIYCMLTDSIDEELLDAATHLRAISQMAVGVDNIDLAACRERGIPVGHTPDVLTETTADTAFGLLIAAARRFREGLTEVTTGRWGPWQPDHLLGVDLHHATLGIIGFGRIGQAIAQRAKGFSMRVLYHQRTRAPEAEAATGAVYADFHELLDRSDHVVVATPLTDETHHLIDRDALSRMRPGASLVNISRGPVVDTHALVEALRSKAIGAAGLDVTDPEPLPGDHPLAALPNAFVLPHLGSSSTATRRAMAVLAARNLVAGLAGHPMPAEATGWVPRPAPRTTS